MPFVESLAAHHDRKGFECGKAPLNDFLQRQARQNADRYLGVTHVIVAERGDSKVQGYYTLVTSSVDPAILPDRKLPRGNPVGVILLGRLATDRTVQRQGMGRQIVLRAMSETAHVARTVGVYALTLHAIDIAAREWYLGLGYGFRTFLDDPDHLYLPMPSIAQLGLPPPTELL